MIVKTDNFISTNRPLAKVPRRVLIVLLGAIGDVVRALPLAVRLKRAWPEVELHWAVEPKSLGIVEGHSCIDRVVLFDRPRGLTAYFDFLKRLRSEKYDLVLDLQRHLKSGFTSFATGAPQRVGFSRNNTKECNHFFNNLHIPAVENFSPKIIHYQKFGDLLGLPVLEPLQFGLDSSDADLNLMRGKISVGNRDEQTVRYMGLIMGSSWPSRFWFPESYAELLRLSYHQYQLTPVLLGAQSEQAFKEMLVEQLSDVPYVDLVEKVRLSELRHLFRLVDVAVGSDSGPMHIAAAVGTPVVSMWGSTSPQRSAPYGSEHLVLFANVACSPCYKRECPGLGQICMKELTPQMVMRKISSVMESRSLFQELG